MFSKNIYAVPYEKIYKSKLNPRLQLRYRDEYNNCSIEKINDVMTVSLYIPKEWNWFEKKNPKPASKEEFYSWPHANHFENPLVIGICIIIL